MTAGGLAATWELTARTEWFRSFPPYLQFGRGLSGGPSPQGGPAVVTTPAPPFVCRRPRYSA